VIGLVAGVFFALFNGLKVWKPVAALGIAGTVLGAAAASVVPNIFQGLSVVSCRTSDSAAVHQLIDSAMDPARLAAIVRQFNLYPGDPRAVQKTQGASHPETGSAAIWQSKDGNRKGQLRRRDQF
jgi:hypothetical protein